MVSGFEPWDEPSERLRDLETAEFAPEIISLFLALPGLRGSWPMSAFQSNGDCFDQSGNARLLTYNGNPTYNYDGLAPYLEMDGTGDFLDRADEAGLDVLGTETYVDAAVRGVTMGCWFWRDLDNAYVLMSKYLNAGNQRAYRLGAAGGGPNLNGAVSGNGAAIDVVWSTTEPSINAWHFGVMRFLPSTELAVFLDGEWTRNVAGIPASIFNSNADFNIGASQNGTSGQLNGRVSLCFLCAAYLNDAIIDSLFDQTRGAFMV